MTVCDVKQCRVPLDSGEKQRALSIQGRTYVVCADCLKVFEEFMGRALEGDKPKAAAHFRLVSVSPIVDSPGPVWLPNITVLPVPLVPAPSTTSPAPAIYYYGGGQAQIEAGGDFISGAFVSDAGAVDTAS